MSTRWLLAMALVVKIPFEFHAGSTRCGPGQYVLVLDGGTGGVVTLRSEPPGRSAVLDVRKDVEGEGPTTSTIAFRAYGDHRFLSAIEVKDGARWDVSASANEPALARTHGAPKVMTLKAQSLAR